MSYYGSIGSLLKHKGKTYFCGQLMQVMEQVGAHWIRNLH